MENLQAWSGVGTTFERTLDKSNLTQGMKIVQSSPERFDVLELECTILHVVDYRALLTATNMTVRSVSRTPVAIATSPHLDAHGFDTVVTMFTSFLAFATTDSSAITRYQLHEADAPSLVDIHDQWATKPGSADRVVSPERFAFDVTDVDSMGDALSRWTTLRGGELRGVDMLLTTVTHPLDHVQTELLLVASAVETLHRELSATHLPQTAYTDNEGNPRGPYYRERAIELSEVPSGAAVAAIAPNVAAWAGAIKRYRNEYAHGEDTRNGDLPDVFALVEQTKGMLWLVLMALVGVSDEAQLNFAERIARNIAS